MRLGPAGQSKWTILLSVPGVVLPFVLIAPGVVLSFFVIAPPSQPQALPVVPTESGSQNSHSQTYVFLK